MYKEKVQELLESCETYLTNLNNNTEQKTQLENALEGILNEISQEIEIGWESGEDMTNETNWYSSLVRQFS
ncbi:MAG: hypothetical protein I3273_06205 [Candidatus Moeniiplasma glomeromycotorum]|nr:hypothetical protein [Candidatus Moeniiplasma glomeromycotorum]MCE8168009.1 hypothetical protein [Candidatus Moeniiplasma glomeromycotorum]MCE8169677.1 hypothetical protein [Candidatus Moeniiplasma glomeromycotorum]